MEHAYTKNTFNNRTALNVERTSPVVKALKDFVGGSVIKVTYYSFLHNFTDKRTGYTSYTDLLSRSIRCYKKIENVELKINGSMSFGSNPDQDENTFEGSGKLLGGMEGRMGDIFLYEVSPGHLGLFVINDSQALAIHTGSFDEVSFSLREYPTNETLTKLEDAVKEHYYYGVLDGVTKRTVLLERQDYINKVGLLNYRKTLIDYYHTEHYSRDLLTYVRPDGVFDPYLVEFMLRCIGFHDHRSYPPINLLPIHDFEHSIWQRLLFGKSLFRALKTTYQIDHVRGHSLTAFVTGLMNRSYLELKDEAPTTYVFSEEFYAGLDIGSTTEPLSSLDQLVFDYITKQDVDLSLLANVHTLIQDKMQEFYHIPIAIYLINVSV